MEFLISLFSMYIVDENLMKEITDATVVSMYVD